MLTGAIIGIDPFVPWSTFKANNLTIPRGLFYGGIFYTAEPYTPPCHISYITGRDEVCLSTWGIADSTGKELAQIYFYDEFSENPLHEWGPNVGHIIDIRGEYGGCLKGRLYHYYNSSVETQEPSDLMVFLKNLRGEYLLNDDSLILDICTCSGVPSSKLPSPSFSSVELPNGCTCEPDDNGMYYIKEEQANNTTPPVVEAISFQPTSGGSVISGSIATVSGANITITPWTMPPEVSGGILISGGVPVSGGRVVNYPTSGAQLSSDIGITIVDGGIVIGRRGRLNEASK